MLKKLKKAFTITELVIVIAVIAILAAVLIPTFANVIENANQSAALQTSSNALRDYQVIALNDDNANNDDMTGVVFVSDGYVYTYINSALQYVGKIEDLYNINKDGTIDADNEEDLTKVGVTISDEAITDNSSVKVDKVLFNYTTSDTPADIPEITTEDLASGTTSSGTTKQDEVLYFYTVNLNDTDYVGWFTMERGTGAETAAYQTQGANYARSYGYANVDTGTLTITYTARP